jgi:hypothetical protein
MRTNRQKEWVEFWQLITLGAVATLGFAILGPVINELLR